jgi:glycosyltransferase involved in cell wall biosynthesis
MKNEINIKNPLVSVVLPTYNRAGLIQEAIASVLEQSYSEFELLIWDDGSTDDTRNVVRSYADDRIKYFCEEHRGQSYALNQAMKRASGTYIAFLDDDDVWHKEKLSVQIHIMEKCPEIDVLFSDFSNVDDAGIDRVSSFSFHREVLEKFGRKEVMPGVNLITSGFLEELVVNFIIGRPSVVIRRRVCDVAGGFNEDLKSSVDLDYWWRVGIEGARFAYMDRILFVRRKVASSLSNSGERSRLNHIKALGYCLDRAREVKREDLIRIVMQASGRCWENLIRLHWQEGQRRKALYAFRKRCAYGLSWRALVMLAGALCGPRMLKVSTRISSVRQEN